MAPIIRANDKPCTEAPLKVPVSRHPIADGTRLLLVTADRVVRVLDVATLAGGARAARR